MKLIISLVMLAILSACAQPKHSIYVEPDRTKPRILAPRPDFPGYGSAVGRQPIRWTGETIAKDFIQLLYYSEYGKQHKYLLKWDGPVTVGIQADELWRHEADIRTLLSHIREAAPGLDVRLTRDDSTNITLRTAPYREMKSLAPTALCFFVPANLNWADYLEARHAGEVSWENDKGLSDVSIFIPAFTSPESVRTCILEEITQALGPGNDLFRLEDSIFNDDNAHEYPTSFDLLILKLLYSSELRPGERIATARRIVNIKIAEEGFAELGEETRRKSPQTKEFNSFMRKTFGIRDAEERLSTAEAAVGIGDVIGDHSAMSSRRFAASAAMKDDNYALAQKYMVEAIELAEQQLPASSVRLARLRSDYAFVELQLENYDEAAAAYRKAIPVYAAHAQDGRLARVYLNLARVLAYQEKMDEARVAADNAIAWGAYSFGSDSKALAAWKDEFVGFGFIYDES